MTKKILILIALILLTSCAGMKKSLDDNVPPSGAVIYPHFSSSALTSDDESPEHSQKAGLGIDIGYQHSNNQILGFVSEAFVTQIKFNKVSFSSKEKAILAGLGFEPQLNVPLPQGPLGGLVVRFKAKLGAFNHTLNSKFDDSLGYYVGFGLGVPSFKSFGPFLNIKVYFLDVNGKASEINQTSLGLSFYF